MYDRSLQYGFACGDTLTASSVLGSKDPENDDGKYLALNLASKRQLGNFKAAGGKSMLDWVDNDMSAAWNLSLAVSQREVAEGKAIAQDLIQQEALLTFHNNETALGVDGGVIPNFVPVCLSTVFMVTVENLLAAPIKNWNTLADALVKGGKDPEERRFMERLWALIFSRAFDKDDRIGMLRQEYTVMKRKGRYKGMVVIERKSRPPDPKRKKKGWKAKRQPWMLQWETQETLLAKYT